MEYEVSSYLHSHGISSSGYVVRAVFPRTACQWCMILLYIWKTCSEFCFLALGLSLSWRRHLHTTWNHPLCTSEGKQGLTLKLSLWFLLCMPENRLARNSRSPVLREIVLAEPSKYFRVVTGRAAEMRCHYIKILMLFAKRTKEQKTQVQEQRRKWNPSDTMKSFLGSLEYQEPELD